MVVVGRFAQMAAMLLALSLGLFYLLHVMPGSPEEMLLASNPSLSAEEVERLRALRGLDRPFLERYRCWLSGRKEASSDEGLPVGDGTCAFWPSREGILGGDLGFSAVHKLPVARVLADRLPHTLRVMVPAFFLALVLSILLGVFAAVRRGRLADRVTRTAAIVAISLPTHWLAMLAVLFFSVKLELLPASGIRDPGGGPLSTLEHAVLPIAVLALFYVGRWARYVRSSMLEVLSLDFIRTARAKGLRERDVIWRHAVPNALLPLITVVSQSIPALFAGALVVERVFAYPGIGTLIHESIQANDHLVAIVVFLVYAALAMFATVVADALYFVVDPRIRAGAALDAGPKWPRGEGPLVRREAP